LMFEPRGEATLSHAGFDCVTSMAPWDPVTSMPTNAKTAAVTAKNLSGNAQDSLPSAQQTNQS